MDDGTHLLQRILEEPAEDTHRLVYADYLEEQGNRARAEFIRVQVELARMPDPTACTECGGELVRQPMSSHSDLSRCSKCPSTHGPFWFDVLARKGKRIRSLARERELFEAHAAAWVPIPEGHTLSVALLDASGRACANVSYARRNVKVTGDMRFYFDRGFASEWWAPLDDIAGEEWECPDCEEKAPSWETGVVECRRCDCTGVVGTAGYAECVFRAHPVTRVHVTTQSPDIVVIHDGTDRHVWRRWPDADTREILPGYLPGFLFDEGANAQFIPGTAYLSSEAAHDALSRRLVRNGRDLAGLPPYEPAKNASTASAGSAPVGWE